MRCPNGDAVLLRELPEGHVLPFSLVLEPRGLPWR